ncbi:MAG: MaoC family dehydratase [Anaerolineales bacterium]
MSDVPEVRSEFDIGEIARFTKTIVESDIATLAELTGDFNPIHINEEFAQRTRFQGRIAHGILSAGLISAVLGMKLPGPGAIYLSQRLNYLYPTRVGDTLTAEVEVTKWSMEKNIIHLSTRCFNQNKINVVEGEAVLLVEPLTASS